MRAPESLRSLEVRQTLRLRSDGFVVGISWSRSYGGSGRPAKVVELDGRLVTLLVMEFF